MRDRDTTPGKTGKRFPETGGELLAGPREQAGPGYQVALMMLCRGH
ncbi:MAG TPA: hypothetical protein VMU54_25850 [Planctomycetota bacterium]|nr:hypothetical protein [Planctomycetota bacterium]